MPEIEKTESEIYMDRLASHAEKCLILMRSRNAKYGSAWKKINWQTFAGICSMKLNRGMEQDLNNPDPKMIDEFMDVANYCFMAMDCLIKDFGQDPEAHL